MYFCPSTVRLRKLLTHFHFFHFRLSTHQPIKWGMSAAHGCKLTSPTRAWQDPAKQLPGHHQQNGKPSATTISVLSSLKDKGGDNGPLQQKEASEVLGDAAEKHLIEINVEQKRKDQVCHFPSQCNIDVLFCGKSERTLNSLSFSSFPSLHTPAIVLIHHSSRDLE